MVANASNCFCLNVYLLMNSTICLTKMCERPHAYTYVCMCARVYRQSWWPLTGLTVEEVTPSTGRQYSFTLFAARSTGLLVFRCRLLERQWQRHANVCCLLFDAWQCCCCAVAQCNQFLISVWSANNNAYGENLYSYKHIHIHTCLTYECMHKNAGVLQLLR